MSIGQNVGATYESDAETPFDMPDAPVPTTNTTPDEADDFQGLGRLLEMAKDDPEKASKEIVKEWERQDSAMERRKVFWDVWTLMLRGVRGARAIYPTRQDLNQVKLYVPLGAMDNVSPLDRTDELCERVTAHLLADQPMPAPEPENDSDEARDAAEFSKRVLLAEAGEGGCNYQAKFRRGHQKAAVFGSGFLYIWADPTGGGPQEQPQNATPQPLQNVSRGTEQGETGEPSVEGTEAAESQPQWKPKLRIDVLDGRGVRFIPEQCAGIGDAEGVMLMPPPRTLGQLKEQFTCLRSDAEDYVGDEVILQMANWRNDAMLWVMPWYAKMGYSTQPVFDEAGKPSDSTLIGLIGYYHTAGPAYRKGAYLLTAGDAYLLHAGTWDDPNTGAPLDLPIAQIRQFDDTDGDDPYGYGLVRKVGPADEVRGTIVVAKLEHIDRWGRPNTYVPIGSTIQPDDMQQRMGIPLFYNSLGGGVPVVEEIPNFDPTSLEFFQEATSFQNDISGLGETAQATEVSTVNSGVQADTVINQSRINLATQIQNLQDGIERTWRVMLQQIRAFWTVEQRMQFTTEDGDYAERNWSRTDLGNTTQVKIAVGSFTQQSPATKIQIAMQYAQVPGLIQDPEELQRIIADGINPQLGMSDNPVVQRVRGQIAAFKQGPSPEWQPAMDQFKQAQQMAVQQAQAEANPPPMAGVIPMTPAQPPNPQQMQQRAQQLVQQQGIQPPPSVFVRVSSDMEQKAALFRHRELVRLTQSKALMKFGPDWASTATSEYEAMRQAAGVMTVQEQTQMAQAAHDAQTKAQVTVEQAKSQGQAQVQQLKSKGDIAVEQARTQGETQHAAVAAATKSHGDVESGKANAMVKGHVDAVLSEQAHAQDMEKTVLEVSLAPATAPPDLKAAASSDAERELQGVS